MYKAGVTTRAVAAKQAQRLIDLLTNADTRKRRIEAGFLDP
jgi:hypothetical protein